MSAIMDTPRPELRWAVVGTGFISGSISEDLGLVPEARRYAVCSRSLDSANAFAAKHGFTVAYASLPNLLADEKVEAIYIATPHSTHAEIAIAALRAGKHVLVEKPLAVNLAEGRAIAAAAAESGKFAMEAMWMRFNPAYTGFVASARSGLIGDVMSVRASFGLPFDRPDSARWSAAKASSTLLDQAIYPVTLAFDVLGRPTRIRAEGRIRNDGVDLSEHFTFEYDDGRFAQLSASMVEFIEPTASISGTEGWITLPAPFWAATEFETRTGGIAKALTEPVLVRHERRGNGYVPMLDAVTEAIRHGRREHAIHPLSESISILNVLDRIRAAMTVNA